VFLEGGIVQQPCSNLSKSAEMLRNASTQNYSCLQRFCKLLKDPAKHRATFARRRSGVRIPSAPLRKNKYLQVKRTRHKVAPECIRGYLLQPVLPQRVLKGAGRAILHSGQYVRVGVQGYGYGGVPQHLGDYLGVDVPR